MNLKEKKVLFIAPRFHKYYLEIIKSFEAAGADVSFYEEVFYSRVYTFARDKLFLPLNNMLDALYFKRILKTIQKNEYDIFFLIRGGLIDNIFLQEIKKSSPNAHAVMYQWDSLVHNDYRNKVQYFDKVYTFDKSDAKILNIKYLPLFYANGYAEIKNEKDNMIWDICFFGTFHSDRLKIIKKVSAFSKKNNLKFHHHLYAGKINQILLLLRRKISLSDLKYFKSNLVSLSQIVEQYRISKSVLDVEMTNQTGLTIRTIEALGAGRKLLTTNASMQNNELMDNNYIQIIDRENPKIDIDFLNEPIKDYSRYDKYHISKWVSQIMSQESSKNEKVEI